jgi:WD40 repeat protein
MDDDVDPDGSKDILITGSADCTARSWNFETGQCLKVFKGKDRDGNNVGHTGAITCMATDALGRILFTGGTDNTVRSWNLLRGEQLKVFSGHTGSVICMQVGITFYAKHRSLVVRGD